MSKRELIEAIREHNHSVKTEFLERFNERDLQAYLDRVCSVLSKPPTSQTADSRRELIVA